MHESYAKLAGAATGSTMTALTMTPFDVVKTRLQTQKPPSGKPCVRNMSSLAQPLAEEELVCVWENGVFRAERVHGFSDAIRHVWRAEGIRGLWKGAGTTLLIGVPSSTSYMLTCWGCVSLVMSGSVSKITATFPLVKHIIQSEGVSTLFVGLAPRIAKIAPACGIMIACFEGVGRLLSDH
ncbi:mitochondrial carrier [Lentinula edodes]|uniref:Mitochondrial carrier n=1 Tax=Lentinula edodes TaxID=5353 RepID=A0A1Q3EG11_LENED|nr:mitochondrial carrier [Lentinula edodes]